MRHAHEPGRVTGHPLFVVFHTVKKLVARQLTIAPRACQDCVAGASLGGRRVLHVEFDPLDENCLGP